MWTDERDQTLISLWGSGETAAEIARTLRTSRNAVLGRVYRLRKAGHEIGRRASRRATPRKPRRPRKPPVTVAKPKLKPAPLPPIPPVTSDSPSILSIRSHQCRFPMWGGEPSTHQSPLCGAPTGGKPYCPAHMKRAYRKVPE